MKKQAALRLIETRTLVVEEFYAEGGGEPCAEGRESTGSGLKGRLEARVAAAGHGG